MDYIPWIILLIIVGPLVYLSARHWDRIRQFSGEVAFEMGKVTWPSQDDVINSTLLVWVTTIFLTILSFCVDSIFGWIIQIIFRG